MNILGDPSGRSVTLLQVEVSDRVNLCYPDDLSTLLEGEILLYLGIATMAPCKWRNNCYSLSCKTYPFYLFLKKIRITAFIPCINIAPNLASSSQRFSWIITTWDNLIFSRWGTIWSAPGEEFLDRSHSKILYFFLLVYSRCMLLVRYSGWQSFIFKPLIFRWKLIFNVPKQYHYDEQRKVSVISIFNKESQSHIRWCWVEILIRKLVWLDFVWGFPRVVSPTCDCCAVGVYDSCMTFVAHSPLQFFFPFNWTLFKYYTLEVTTVLSWNITPR